MSIHCAFLFPEGEFQLLQESTIGFVSDNMFYRHNFETNTTEIQQNPYGRSYQCISANHKRGLIALADYGKNPNIEFRSLYAPKQKKQPESARSLSDNATIQNFQLTDICKLQILNMELSLDCTYLLVCCGVPEQEIIVVNVKNRCKLGGNKDSVINLDRKFNRQGQKLQNSVKLINAFKTMKFNPGNEKVFAVMFEKVIQIYEIVDNFIVSGNKVEEGIRIFKKSEIILDLDSPSFQTFVWDELNNLYISDGHHLIIYSTDTASEVLRHELEGDFDFRAISSFILTPKHLLMVYSSGRIEWLNKYYPDAMEEEDPKLRPLYLENYYEFSSEYKNKGSVVYATYDHFYQKIIVSHSNGFYSVINYEAESNQIDEEDEDNNRKKERQRGEEKKDLKGDLNIKQIGPYFRRNCNPKLKQKRGVILCKQIKGTSLLFAISSTGRIIIWSAVQKGPASYTDLEIDVCSADISEDYAVLATANANGIVQFYSIANIENIYLFREFKLVQNGCEIDQIAFSSNSKQLACLCCQTKRIYYLLTDPKYQFQVFGYCTLPYTPVSIAWHKHQKSPIKPKYQHLLANISMGVIMINSPSPVSTALTSSPPQQIQGVDMYACRTDPHQSIVFSLETCDIITSGEDLFFKKYKLPEDPISKFNPEAKSAIPAPIDEIEAHDLDVVSASVGKNGQIITSSKDGTVQIHSPDFKGDAQTFKAHGWRTNNLVTCEGSQTDGLYYSCGRDGIICMWKTKELEISLSDKLPCSDSTFKKIDSKKQNLNHYVTVMEEEYLEKMKEAISKKKKAQLDKIVHIRSELKELLVQNQSHEELEQLTRDEFAIDEESRELVLKKGEQICQRIKKQSHQKVLYDEVYRKKLKEITWDVMEEHLRAINGMKNNYIIFNYQIRKQSTEQKRILKVIIDMRRLQIREDKKNRKVLKNQFYYNKNIVNGGVTQPLILNIFEKKQEKKDEKGKKKKEDEPEKQPEQIEELPQDEVFQLLYSSFELYSDNSKMNQVVLMQNVIFKIKQLFNKEFNKLMKMRQSQNELINDKNKRIIEICEELKRANEIIIAKKNILENPDVLLEVHPNQIPFSRYLSRDERQKLEHQRLKEEERMRLLAEDDSSQRALALMMGGTLQQKKTSLLEVVVEREKWMEKPVEEMSEDEKAKLKEYEQKKQKAEEERERMVKKLEAELRKLKQQIEELMDKYDERLFNLIKRRIEYDLRIEEQELYCIKLSLSIINAKEQTERFRKLQEHQKYYKERHQLLDDYRDQLREYQENLERLKNEKHGALEAKKQADIETKIKTVEKTVFEDYNNNLKKRREKQEKILESGDKLAHYRLIPLDPAKEIESKLLSQSNAQSFKFFLPEIKELQQTYEFPDSLINILQNRFAIKKEEQDYQRKLKTMKQTINKVEEDIKAEEIAEFKEQSEISKIDAYLKLQKTNLELQCRIKKGQVQIDEDSPVPRLQDALLINKVQIDEKNTNIIEKAKLKIDVMGQIKTCKIRFTEDTLNLERKQSLIDQLCSMIKEVQMLKVKKEMQKALAKKDTKINENELRSLKEQIEKVRKEGEKRISLLQKKIEKVGQEIETIKRENKQLDVQKWNLDNTVKQREKIKEMMVGQNGGGNQEAAEKFDQISINRKLFDKAKQQTQQIQLLREQLSKLKAKTFANFSNVQR